MRILLGRTHEPVKFRKENCSDAGFPGASQVFGMRACHKLGQLRLDSLRAHLPKIFRMSPDRGLCFFFHEKAKLGGKPHGPHDPQGVFGKPLIGVSHTADNSFFQILFSGKGIHQPAFLVVSHGIYGEIPSF